MEVASARIAVQPAIHIPVKRFAAVPDREKKRGYCFRFFPVNCFSASIKIKLLQGFPLMVNGFNSEGVIPVDDDITELGRCNFSPGKLFHSIQFFSETSAWLA